MRITKSLIVGIFFLFTHLILFAQTNPLYGPDDFIRIEEGSGGFDGTIDGGDRFSRDHDVVGDINNDGVLDLVVGARSDDDGATDAGAVYILFMNNDGTVSSHQKISMLAGNFNETLTTGNFFGYGVAGIGDYNDDQIPDIAVSAPTASNRSIYIIHLNRNGTVKSFVKNSGIIAQGLSAIGDLNEDGRIDLVACNAGSDDGGTDRGAISILFLNENAEIEPSEVVTISSTQGSFGSGLQNGDGFGGREAAMLGDIDGDGNKELAVGAFQSEGGKGAIWILSLSNDDYTVVSKRKITEGRAGFNDILDDSSNPNGTSGAQFGHAMASPGDLNSDGIPDLITGANQQGEGHAYILYLNPDKTVKTFTKINNIEGGFDLSLEPEERFSRSISFIGDLRGDGSIAVNIGGGAGGTGTLYLLFFKPCEFPQEPGFNFWSGGTTLFTNWNHGTQTVTGPLTLEQCAVRAYETDAAYITFKESDGRCICKADDAILTTSDELSTALVNTCYSNYTGDSSNTSNIVTMRKGNALNFGIDGNHNGKNGQDIYLWSYDTENINQQWEEIDRGDGYYSYKKAGTNFCIDGGNGGSNGQNVYLWACSENNQNQQWKKVLLDNKRYRLEKRNAPRYSIDGNQGGSNRQSIYLSSSNDNNQNQQWVFTAVETIENTSELTAKNQDNNSLSIYPVPVKDILYLENNSLLEINRIEIRDITGKMIYEKSLTNTSSSIEIIDTHNLVNGIYLLSVFDNSQLNRTIRFIK